MVVFYVYGLNIQKKEARRLASFFKNLNRTT